MFTGIISDVGRVRAVTKKLQKTARSLGYPRTVQRDHRADDLGRELRPPEAGALQPFVSL